MSNQLMTKNIRTSTIWWNIFSHKLINRSVISHYYNLVLTSSSIHTLQNRPDKYTFLWDFASSISKRHSSYSVKVTIWKTSDKKRQIVTICLMVSWQRVLFLKYTWFLIFHHYFDICVLVHSREGLLWSLTISLCDLCYNRKVSFDVRSVIVHVRFIYFSLI